MKKIQFEFLATMELKEIEKPITQVNAEKQPTNGADLRLFSDGAIYPSATLITLDELEYQPKDSGKPEYGYDVFLSTEWTQYPQEAPAIVCIAKVSKHYSRVDLFSKAKYNTDGTAKNSVSLQRQTSGEELIKMLEAAYCENEETLFQGGKTFVDLKIVKNTPVKAVSNGIYLIPKKFVKGEKAGQTLYERRENITVYALQVLEPTVIKPPHVTNTETPVARPPFTPPPSSQAENAPVAKDESTQDIAAALFK